ncbi:MAG: NADPH-dependent oxidoreductase [Nevskiaceae bacterium]|nr:MAG: NADPH-dependent oxidoreductase [Nevskiaceae bacterium]TBR74575.1 MAG: NADPH-dependent oxidoreductase [Nevskiaceae bacterium]
MRNGQPLIFGIGGSLSRRSISECALRFTMDAAEKCGAQTEIMVGRDLDLPNYDAHDPARLAAAHVLLRNFRDCDGVIVSASAYHGAISGMLKNALDYVAEISDPGRTFLEGRAVGCVVCAGGEQAGGTCLSGLRTIVHALRGWPTPLGVTVNARDGSFDADGQCVDDTTRTHLELLAEQVVVFARRYAPAQPAREESSC